MGALVKAAGSWLLARPWLIVIAVLLGVIAIRTLERDAARQLAEHRGNIIKIERANHRTTIANYRAAAAKRLADDLANERRVRERDLKIAEETQNELRTKLAAADRDAAAFAGRLRAQRSAGAAAGGAGAARLPGASQPATGPVGTGPATELDDARICARNTVLAEGWQAWWRGRVIDWEADRTVQPQP